MKKIIVILSITIFLLSACGNKYEGDISIPVEPFTFTNQNGESFDSSELEGKFWVADMIFTNCETVCPPMTSNLVRLQNKLDNEGLDVEIVSFTVDPENDTPELLKQYVEDRGGHFDNWNLLTGYEFDEIKEFAVKSFKAIVEKDPESDQFIHVTRFYLVSPEGNAIMRYDGTQAAEMDDIVADIKKMN
ncbi:SCO family protein [Aquibacillus koreensis]|uniref:SCO family protein n=1 Tax=Aquibacillus koreensis TaxID=279446 RepID=A0A9X4AIE5_9BACI|nr:SCO family protein [Aquibacillus koreensis]MCT2534333.1 SCO family protein [Aquibacillus koreensis]MDC3420654.1 SCO family protein [Aquibacillus koreensis]